jgi:hypothetical protein
MEATLGHEKPAQVATRGFAYDFRSFVAELAHIPMFRRRRQTHDCGALEQHAQIKQFVVLAFRSNRDAKTTVSHRLDEVGAYEVE